MRYGQVASQSKSVPSQGDFFYFFEYESRAFIEN